MAVVDTFTGRCSPYTGAPVVVELLRQFDQKTLEDVWALRFSSGAQEEYYDGLTYNQAISKWRYAEAWWK